VGNDQHPLVKAYHQVLTWQITDNPLPLRIAEAMTAPFIGKSIVIYARRDA
jgi:hypothetical protein